MTRSTTVAAALAITLLAAACTGGLPPSAPASDSTAAASPAPTPSLWPSPTATPEPVPTPSFAAPDAQAIRAAADALDALDSYRYTLTMEGMGVRSTGDGVVVNGDAPRTSLTTRTGGLVTGQVVIAGKTWYSMAGSPWVHEARLDADPADRWINPVADAALGQLDSIDRFEEAGLERWDGRLVRHVHAVAEPDEATEEGMFGEPGDWFTGTLDAWILVDEGHLVAVQVDGVTDLGWGEDDAADATPTAVSITVAGEDDPSNVVEEPVVAEATPVPSSEPEAAALLAGLDDALARLDAYELVFESDMGLRATGSLTIINRPRRAALYRTETAPGPFASLEILVIGKDAWSTWDGAGWTKATKDSRPTCGGSGSSEDMEPCTFEALTRVVTAQADTEGLAVVARGEVVEGYACTHLRSSAPQLAGGLALPGTTDTWIAEDGGFLVRTTFTGQGFTSNATVTRVNDPTLHLEPPGD